MSFVRLNLGFSTLRARLTLWNTVVVWLLVAVTLVVVREGLRDLLVNRLDEFLLEETEEIKDDIHERSPKWTDIHRDINFKVMVHPRRRMFVQIFTDSGTLLWTSDQTPPRDWAERLLPGSGDRIVLDDYRVVQEPIPGSGLVIRVGASTQRLSNDLAQFTRYMLVVSGVVLLLTPAAGYLLAVRATQPIAKIIDTATRLHPTKLDERLPVRGTHDELDRLSQTINGLLDRIAKYLKQNREFNASAAHELRTPLTAIQTSLEVTLLGDRTVEEYKEELMQLLEEFNHLRVLVNQLLLLAEGDAGQLCTVRQPTRLDQIVRKSMDMFQAVFEVKGVALRSPRLDEIVVSADSSALRQVVNNLLDNAIKHTPAGGNVVIELSRDGKADECVLSVRDTGSGIPAADLPHIFQRFYRADKSRARDQPHSGTGLGLSICRAIVEVHAGTIAVASNPGEGAAFTIRLPTGAAPP